MAGESVLVFGATGAVGGAAAQEAASRGSKVYLATRDPAKPISWLTKEKEDDGTYTRVKADLGDTASITEAVKQSGAKSAFVYLVHGISSKAAFQALKDAGVTWVVLLSSFTVTGDLTKYTEEYYIPYHHAQGELELREVGIAYGAVRPGYFASNMFMFFMPSLKGKGEINLYRPDEVKYDWIDPQNIGQVAGSLLVQPKPELKPAEPQIVYLYGPEFISQTEVIKRIGKLTGKEYKVNSVSSEQFSKELSSHGMPDGFVKYLVEQTNWVVDDDYYIKQAGHGQADNIKKYSGKTPTTLDEFLEASKSQLQS